MIVIIKTELKSGTQDCTNKIQDVLECNVIYNSVYRYLIFK